MANLMNAAAERRLSVYFDRIGAVLGRKGRRESFALYAEGVFGDGERKSIEPIAARACADPARADAEHQRLLHFALDAPWSDDAVRREAASYALDAMTAHEPVDSWIIDDTGFLKQGKHSVGVQRQYTGSAGKTANCPDRRQLDGGNPHRAGADRLRIVSARDLDGRPSAPAGSADPRRCSVRDEDSPRAATAPARDRQRRPAWAR